MCQFQVGLVRIPHLNHRLQEVAEVAEVAEAAEEQELLLEVRTLETEKVVKSLKVQTKVLSRAHLPREVEAEDAEEEQLQQ